jgi:DNA-binding NarL/FixJ family response regulator
MLDMDLRVYLVQWDAQAALVRSARLAAEGWKVSAESKDGEEAYQQIRHDRPDVVVFDLSTKPSHSLQVAEALRKCHSLAAVPFVFVDGDSRALHTASQRIGNALFTNSDDLVRKVHDLSDTLFACLA